MAPRRLRDGRVHALLALLLLLLLLWPPVTRGTTCPTPTSVEHADIRVKSYNVNSRERYVCNSGFKRKAGTSSLIQCVLNETTNIAHWTTPNLKCILTISTSVSTFCTVLVMLLLLWCFRSRQTSQPPAVEVERMEVMPMTPGTSSREEEDTGIY
uniref:Interleukin-15 receptor subunit alpha n=1 Tax=Castor canadensis TaxID=51338 RepID=A0A8C0X9N4_CASCN